jgi:predicted alpha/beta superfamily hydrolase
VRIAWLVLVLLGCAVPETGTRDGQDGQVGDQGALDWSQPDAGADHGRALDADARDAGDAPDMQTEACGGANPRPDLAAQWDGRWGWLPAFDSAHVAPRGITIYLPAGYDATDARYPVLYLHDGQNLFDPQHAAFGQAWHVDDAVHGLGARIEPLIIVGIHNTDARMAEYTPTADAEFGGGDAPAYGRFLVHELKPWIDATLRTRCDRLNTGVAGSSLGGLVSVWLLHTYPEVFGRVAALSPSFWWDDRVAHTWIDGLAAGWLPGTRLWIDGGNREGNDADQDGRSSVLADARVVVDGLVAAGVPFAEAVAYLEGPEDAHDEPAWARRLPAVLAWMWGPTPGVPERLAVRTLAPSVPVGGRRGLSVDAYWAEPLMMTLPASVGERAVGPEGIVARAGDGVVGLAPGAVTVAAAWRGQQASAQWVVVAAEALHFEVHAPVGTPADAPLFVVGNLPVLGDWQPADGLRLDPVGEDVWHGTALVDAGTALEFKITRGSWETVEKDLAGEELPNHRAVAEPGETLQIAVARWADWE